MARRANVQGISVGSTQMFKAMNRAITANRIKPMIDKVFGFDDVEAAYQHMAFKMSACTCTYRGNSAIVVKQR